MWLRVETNNKLFVNITLLFGIQEKRRGFLSPNPSTSEETSVLSVVIGYFHVLNVLVPHVRNRYLPFT
jgi:hypothetical protein